MPTEIVKEPPKPSPFSPPRNPGFPMPIVPGTPTPVYDGSNLRNVDNKAIDEAANRVSTFLLGGYGAAAAPAYNPGDVVFDYRISGKAFRLCRALVTVQCVLRVFLNESPQYISWQGLASAASTALSISPFAFYHIKVDIAPWSTAGPTAEAFATLEIFENGLNINA